MHVCTEHAHFPSIPTAPAADGSSTHTEAHGGTRRHTQQPPVCAEANISINNAGRNPDGVGEARRAASAERK